jgi:hypothetical protein
MAARIDLETVEVAEFFLITAPNNSEHTCLMAFFIVSIPPIERELKAN